VMFTVSVDDADFSVELGGTMSTGIGRNRQHRLVVIAVGFCYSVLGCTLGVTTLRSSD
jgi:hypothetical protein